MPLCILAAEMASMSRAGTGELEFLLKQSRFISILVGITLLWLAPVSLGSILGAWALTGDGTGTSEETDKVTVGDFVGGAGINAITYGTSGGYANLWTTNAALDAADYFEVSIAPQTGYGLVITGIDYSERRSGTGIREFQVRVSTNNFASHVVLATEAVPDNDSERTYSITDLGLSVAEGQMFRLRFYGYLAEAGTGNWRINDNSLMIFGTAVPTSGPPVIGFTPSSSSQQVQVSNTLTLAVSIPSSGAGMQSWSLTPAYSGSANLINGIFTFTPANSDSNNDFTLSVVGTNSVGSSTGSVTITVTAVAPVITLSPASSYDILATQTQNIVVVVAPDGSGIQSWSLLPSNYAGSATLVDTNFTFTTAHTDGPRNYALSVTATNVFGTTTSTAEIVVSGPPVPVITFRPSGPCDIMATRTQKVGIAVSPAGSGISGWNLLPGDYAGSATLLGTNFAFATAAQDADKTYTFSLIATNATGVSTGMVAISVWGDYIWATNADNTITIKNYIGPGGNITIPDAINGLSVVNIASNAFRTNSGLTSVSIPNNITNIGGWAFYSCRRLTNALIGNGVVDIGSYAFSSCTSLTSVVLGNSIANIGDSAFQSCTSLADVAIPDSVTNLGNSAFYSCSNLTSATIGNRISIIGTNAFRSCRNLSSIVFNTSVSSIKQTAFHGCASLTSVTIPDSVTSIGSWAFFSCSSLTNVAIGSGVTNIGLEVFISASLAEITVDASNPAFRSTNGVLFSKNIADLIQCPGGKVGSYSVPANVTNVGISAFYGCSGLTNIVIPDSVVGIGAKAFSGCNNLFDISVPDAVTEIRMNTFSNCTSLASATIGSSVTNIEAHAFINCLSLKNISIPIKAIGGIDLTGCTGTVNCVFYTNNADSVTVVFIDSPNSYPDNWRVAIPDHVNGRPVVEIGTGGTVFPRPGLSDLLLPESVTKINSRAFSCCTALTNLVIPTNVTYIGADAFNNCAALARIAIPDGVRNIEYATFSGCTNLIVAMIGNGVSNIEYNAFAECSHLERIYFRGDAPNLHSAGVFNGADNVTVRRWSGAVGWPEVPGPWGGRSTSLWSQPHEFGYTYNLPATNAVTISAYTGPGDWVEIPSSISGRVVKGIGLGAFSGSPGVSRIEIPASVERIDANAFSGCVNLIEIEIPAGVACIGGEAFSGCRNMVEARILNGVTNIGDRAFEGCTNLARVYFRGDAPDLRGTDVFNGADRATIYHWSGAEDWPEVPNPWGGRPTSLWSLPQEFHGMNENGDCVITNYSGPGGWVEIPPVLEGRLVTGIDSNAFYANPRLTRVIIPYSVTHLGTQEFLACGNLVEIGVCDGNSEYGSADGVLFDATLTRLILYPAGKTGGYIVPDGVLNIESNAFIDCRRLTEVTLPGSATEIGSYSFARCFGLTNVTIRAGVSRFGNYVFAWCTNLVSFYCHGHADWPSPYWPGEFVFGGCTNATIYRLAGARGWEDLMTGWTIYDPSIEDWQPNADFLVALNSWDASTLAITSYIGSGNDAVIPAYILGKRVTEIETAAFNAADNLSTITIPSSVTNIWGSAFIWGYGLTSIYFHGDAPNADGDVFDGAIPTDLTVYYRPGTAGWPEVPSLWPEGLYGRATAHWLPKVMPEGFGVQAGQYGFNVGWAEGQTVVVEACTNLADPVWVPLETNTIAGDAFHFSDSLWTNYPGRFYRIRHLP